VKRYQTIVVAAALDDRDATTLRHAARFAQAAASKAVYAAHIIPSFDLPAEVAEKQPELVLPVDEMIEGRLRATVEGQRSLFPAGTNVQCVARQGSLVPELIRLAAQKSADLFCLGCRPPQDNDLLSESAMRLVRKVPCSVFVVPPGVEPHYERILVPVDFSDHSREALEVACAIAQSMPGASVTVQHTYEVPLGWHKSGHSYDEFAAIMKGHAERHWNMLLPKVNFRGVPWSVRFDLGDKVPQTILQVADEIDSNLVVMGSHGRTRPAAFLLGHVADKVCATTARPVLCVKRKGEVVNFLHAMLQFFEFEDK
jgi:nucleotide-binding universal stress UspA family protein